MTIGVPGPPGLPMLWQGATPIVPGQSPYSAKVLQPVALDLRAGAITVILPALSDAETTVVAIKDLYGASGTNACTIETSDGSSVEDPSTPGTFRNGTPAWAKIDSPTQSPVWLVGMASINAWVLWVAPATVTTDGLMPTLRATDPPFGATGAVGVSQNVACQAMLDYAKAIGGARCYFPPVPSGNYFLTSPLFIDGSNSEIFSDYFTSFWDRSYDAGGNLYQGEFLGPLFAQCTPTPVYSSALPGSFALVNGSAVVATTVDLTRTLAANNTIRFNGDSSNTIYTVLSVSDSPSNSVTLTAPYTGQSNAASAGTINYYPYANYLVGTFNVSASANVPTTASQVGVLEPGSPIIFAQDTTQTVYTVQAVSVGSVTLTTAYTGTAHASTGAIFLGANETSGINLVNWRFQDLNNGSYLRLSETGAGFLGGLGPSTSPSTGLTVECFVYLNSYTSGETYTPIVNGGGGVGPGGAFAAYTYGYPYRATSLGLSNGYLAGDLATTTNKYTFPSGPGYPQFNANGVGIQIPLRTLTHIAMSWGADGYIHFFVNGIEDTTLKTAITGTIIQDVTEQLTMGCMFSGYIKPGTGYFGELIATNFDGFMGGLRISATQEYTANFTPPTAELATDAWTIYLLNFDPSNIQRDLFVTGTSTYLNDIRIGLLQGNGVAQKTMKVWNRWNASLGDGQGSTWNHIHDLNLQKFQTGMAYYAQLAPFNKFERLWLTGTIGGTWFNNCFECTYRQIFVNGGNAFVNGTHGYYTAESYGFCGVGAANQNSIEHIQFVYGGNMSFALILGGSGWMITDPLIEGCGNTYGDILLIAAPDCAVQVMDLGATNEGGGLTDCVIRLLNTSYNRTAMLSLYQGSGTTNNWGGKGVIVCGPWSITNDACLITAGFAIGGSATPIYLSSSFNTASVLPVVKITSTGFAGSGLQAQYSPDGGNTYSTAFTVPSSGLVIPNVGGTTTLCPDGYTGTVPAATFSASGTLNPSTIQNVFVRIVSPTTYVLGTGVYSPPDSSAVAFTPGSTVVNCGGGVQFTFVAGSYVAGTVYALQFLNFNYNGEGTTFTASSTPLQSQPLLSFYPSQIASNGDVPFPNGSAYLPGNTQPPVKWDVPNQILFAVTAGGVATQQNATLVSSDNPGPVRIPSMESSYRQLYWATAVTAYVDSTSFMYETIAVAGPDVTSVVLPFVCKGYKKTIINNTANPITVGGTNAYGGAITGSTVAIPVGTAAVIISTGSGWLAIAASGGGGITALTGDVTASGSGSVAATVNKISGASPIDVVASQTVLNSGSTNNAVSSVTAATTANATPLVAFSVALAAASVSRFVVNVLGLDTGGSGDAYSADFECIVQRAGSGAAVLIPTTPVPYNQLTNGSGSSMSSSITLSSNTLDVNVTGLAATTIHWNITVTQTEVS